MRPSILGLVIVVLSAAMNLAHASTNTATNAGVTGDSTQNSDLSDQPPTKSGGKSAKKRSADSIQIRPPQVLEEGDTSLSLRASQGGVYTTSPLVTLGLERMIKPNIGIAAVVGYSDYSSTLSAGPYTAEMDYTVWTAALIASFHADVLKVKNLDTYLSLGYGHAFINTEVKSNIGDISPDASAAGAANFFVASLNARYFVDSSWAFTASLGTGLGTFGVGIDYLF